MAKSGKTKIKRKNSQQVEQKSVSVSGATKNRRPRTVHKDSGFNSPSPKEIIHNILLLLPPSVLQENMRFVCKEWNAIITDPLFIREHLGHSLSSPATAGFLVQDKDLNDAKVKRAFYVRLYDRAMTKLKLPFEATILGSCNGLLLLHNAIARGNLFVVNLVTKAYISLPPLALAGVYARHRPSAVLAFAPSSGQYKVIYVSRALKDNQARIINPGEVKVMVCTIAVDTTWRAIDCQGIAMSEDVKETLMSCPFSSAGGYICWFHKHVSYGFALDIEAETMYQFAGPEDHVIMPSTRICIIPMDTGAGVLHKQCLGKKCWKVWEMIEPRTGTWGTLSFDVAGLDSAIARHFGPQTVAGTIPLLISMKTEELWLSCCVWFSHDYNIGLICYNWKTKSIWSPSTRWPRHLALPHLHVNSLLSLKNL